GIVPVVNARVVRDTAPPVTALGPDAGGVAHEQRIIRRRRRAPFPAARKADRHTDTTAMGLGTGSEAWGLSSGTAEAGTEQGKSFKAVAGGLRGQTVLSHGIPRVFHVNRRINHMIVTLPRLWKVRHFVIWRIKNSFFLRASRAISPWSQLSYDGE